MCRTDAAVSGISWARRGGRARAVVIAVTLAVLGCGSRDAAAQMFITTGSDTLRGLPGVEVAAEVAPELEQAGVTASLVRSEVARRLDGARIRVYTSQAENPSPAKPYLYVHVNALHLDSQGLYVVAVQVHLRQTLRSPVTDSNVVNAMSWDAHNVLVVPAKELRSVLDEIQEYVDQFIADWAKVH